MSELSMRPEAGTGASVAMPFKSLRFPLTLGERIGLLRGLLLAACAGTLAVTLAATLAAVPMGPVLEMEIELVHLLRGMALIKGAIFAAVLALIWWRLGQPVGNLAAGAYMLGAATMAMSPVLIWQIQFVALGAGLFHFSAAALLVLALLEGSPRQWVSGSGRQGGRNAELGANGQLGSPDAP